MSADLSPRASTTTLKLFTPDQLDAADADHVSGLSPTMTLPEFGRAYVVATWLKERRASPLTVGGYERSLSLWEQLTDNLPLCLLNDVHTSQFVGGLFELPGKDAGSKASPATVHKHCRNVRTCLNLSGPKTRTYKKARRLIDDPPSIEMPTLEDDDVQDNFEVHEIEAIVRACHKMTLPREHDWQMPPRGRRKQAATIAGTGIRPDHWWRSLLSVVYNTGERKGAIFKVELPAPTAELIHFPAVTRKGKRKGHAVPLNRYAKEAIEIIRTDRRLLFPWPHSPRTEKGSELFGTEKGSELFY